MTERPSTPTPRGSTSPIDGALWKLLAATSTTSGDEFFRALARTLAEALDVPLIFVTEVIQSEPGRVRAVASWMDGAWGEPYEYDIQGTPCEHVARTGKAWPWRVFISPLTLCLALPSAMVFAKRSASSPGPVPNMRSQDFPRTSPRSKPVIPSAWLLKKVICPPLSTVRTPVSRESKMNLSRRSSCRTRSSRLVKTE